MVKDATSELHVAAIQAMLEAAADCPGPFAALYKGQLAWLKSFLSHTDATGVQRLPFNSCAFTPGSSYERGGGRVSTTPNLPKS